MINSYYINSLIIIFLYQNALALDIISIIKPEFSELPSKLIEKTLYPKRKPQTMKKMLVSYWEDNNLVKNKDIISAFMAIPRELFVLTPYKDEVYLDKPLPIPAGQTISQPTTVVLMLDALDIKQGQKILEVGTGSGYNAALLGQLVGPQGQVITTEIIPTLHDFAVHNLNKIGIKNVIPIKSDGSLGYSKDAPYDRIIVTAGAPKIPSALLAQLANGGILLIPVDEGEIQRMIRIQKIDSKVIQENLGEYKFVPLTGKYGK